MDVRVSFDEMIANDGSELLRGIDGVLLCEDVCGLLLSIGSNNDGVVSLCIARNSECIL